MGIESGTKHPIEVEATEKRGAREKKLNKL